MNSTLFFSQVNHARHETVPHTFKYPILMLGVDLDELPELSRKNRLFGYNRSRPFALRDRDYLFGPEGSIRQKLLELLEQCGFHAHPSRVFLVTMPRVWGYCFNPVSFYYLYDARDCLIGAVAEVNNTFRERHCYILTEPKEVEATSRFVSPKVFHVSPFFSRDGHYEFTFSDIRQTLDIRIRLVRDGKVAFSSNLRGAAHPLNEHSLAWALMKRPLSSFLTMSRIITQAAWLHYRLKLPIFPKPEPCSPLTVSTARPSRRERIARRILHRRMKAIPSGVLTILEPEGARITFKGRHPGREVILRIKNYRAYWRVLIGGDVGFGESYTAGDWETEHLSDFLLFLLDNRDGMGDYRLATSHVSHLVDRFIHYTHRNTTARAQRNIHDHYDLGNRFFELFLDQGMVYSCARFLSEQDSLEQAQKNKIKTVLDKADIQPGQEILEIGCGWGGLLIEAARRGGGRVTGATLSEQQFEYVRNRIRAEGLDDRVRVVLQDYRSIEGRFDRIVSVEMFEAVGKEYFQEFFRTCDRLLGADGRAILQVITIAEERYPAYARGCDWIQKHIFPGGCLPSLPAVCAAIADSSSLITRDIEHIGNDYVRTLREWRRRFEANRERIRALGYSPEFMRKWRYYLAYCEAGFASGSLGTVQLILEKHAMGDAPQQTGLAQRVTERGVR